MKSKQVDCELAVNTDGHIHDTRSTRGKHIFRKSCDLSWVARGYAQPAPSER